MARVTPDDPAPHIDEAILLGVVDKHLLVREFPCRQLTRKAGQLRTEAQRPLTTLYASAQP